MRPVGSWRRSVNRSVDVPPSASRWRGTSARTGVPGPIGPGTPRGGSVPADSAASAYRAAGGLGRSCGRLRPRRPAPPQPRPDDLPHDPPGKRPEPGELAGDNAEPERLQLLVCEVESGAVRVLGVTDRMAQVGDLDAADSSVAVRRLPVRNLVGVKLDVLVHVGSLHRVLAAGGFADKGNDARHHCAFAGAALVRLVRRLGTFWGRAGWRLGAATPNQP